MALRVGKYAFNVGAVEKFIDKVAIGSDNQEQYITKEDALKIVEMIDKNTRKLVDPTYEELEKAVGKASDKFQRNYALFQWFYKEFYGEDGKPLDGCQDSNLREYVDKAKFSTSQLLPFLDVWYKRNPDNYGITMSADGKQRTLCITDTLSDKAFRMFMLQQLKYSTMLLSHAIEEFTDIYEEYCDIDIEDIMDEAYAMINEAKDKNKEDENR